MTARSRFTILAAVLAASAAGCGQQGPLVLPPDARPVERVDTGTTDAGAVDPDQDDERQDEP